MERQIILIGGAVVCVIIFFVVLRFLNIRAMNKRLTQKAQTVSTPDELVSELPKWSIRDRKPSKFWNGNKEFIQVVLLSKVIGTRTFWAVWDGIGLIRTETRAYRVPKNNIYGDIFIWDVDKKQSITEVLQVGEEDAEDSFHELQVANMYYSIGRIAGSNELDKKIGFIYILSIFTLLAALGVGVLVFFKTKDISATMQIILTQVQQVNVPGVQGVP